MTGRRTANDFIEFFYADTINQITRISLMKIPDKRMDRTKGRK
jgi:hypothetical protein